MTKNFDAVVIGGGAAGLSGALVLARSRRTVAVVDSGTPRNAPAHGVHGLLGHDGIPPADLLKRGREEVEGYGGQIIAGEVAATARVQDGFTVTLRDGRVLHARRLLVATGLRDVLPDVPGLARHWGRGLVHCPYCHGWEVRDEPIGVLAVGPTSVHHALLFRQLTDDLVYFANGTGLDAETRASFAAKGIRVVDTPVAEVESDGDDISGVRLTDGEVVPRQVIAVVTRMLARTEGVIMCCVTAISLGGWRDVAELYELRPRVLAARHRHRRSGERHRCSRQQQRQPLRQVVARDEPRPALGVGDEAVRLPGLPGRDRAPAAAARCADR
ncbi:NAD(P)/FAD-dependent oxidoreductase [Lentzea chajnantorensis]